MAYARQYTTVWAGRPESSTENSSPSAFTTWSSTSGSALSALQQTPHSVKGLSPCSSNAPSTWADDEVTLRTSPVCTVAGMPSGKAVTQMLSTSTSPPVVSLAILMRFTFFSFIAMVFSVEVSSSRYFRQVAPASSDTYTERSFPVRPSVNDRLTTPCCSTGVMT